ncbi:hypothetical protein AVEN_87335-1 [Araneus ventricosus]|uniref:Uncharacterized protein n=1 Tax=Araneus ventricosus TaxID=182803 RepID=A0A4Y2HDX8_ARAVE|nr:hypothetical protein AVEN_87335-1 [Araneus ventricosus]
MDYRRPKSTDVVFFLYSWFVFGINEGARWMRNEGTVIGNDWILPRWSSVVGFVRDRWFLLDLEQQEKQRLVWCRRFVFEFFHLNCMDFSERVLDDFYFLVYEVCEEKVL